MFIKLTRRGPNEYDQLVEAYRDDAGRPKQRTVASLGRLDQISTELNSVISGLLHMRLRASDTQLSPERALDELRRIQHHQVIVNDTQPVTGLSTISQEHTAILAALTIKKPSLNTQLSLL